MGGGVVKAVVSGLGALEAIVIDPGAVDPDDVEMLQDLIVAAVNEGLRQVAGAAGQALRRHHRSASAPVSATCSASR